MRDQVMTFLGAGHDTTATGVAWTLHLLSTHSAVQARLRAEIKEHYPFLFSADAAARNDVGRLSSIDPDHLPYLDNVCRESLRYIPTIPMTVRESIAPDYLGGYYVPAKTTIYIHVNAIHRLPSFWGGNSGDDTVTTATSSASDEKKRIPSPGVSDPDRWDNLPNGWSSNAYMTFLQGPRGCIGRKFAETEMKTLLVSLLSRFDFERVEGLANPEDWKMWRLVLRPRDGVELKVRMLAHEDKSDEMGKNGRPEEALGNFATL